VDLFRAFPSRHVRSLCADCRASIESTGLALTPIEGWAGRAVRNELPTSVVGGIQVIGR
jgi:hypothetical protein